MRVSLDPENSCQPLTTPVDRSRGAQVEVVFVHKTHNASRLMTGMCAHKSHACTFALCVIRSMHTVQKVRSVECRVSCSDACVNRAFSVVRCSLGRLHSGCGTVNPAVQSMNTACTWVCGKCTCYPMSAIHNVTLTKAGWCVWLAQTVGLVLSWLVR